MPFRPANINPDQKDLAHVLNQSIRETNNRIDDLRKAALTKLRSTSTLVFPLIPANSCKDSVVNLQGAIQSVGVAHASPQVSLGNSNLTWASFISANHQVTVRVCNPTVAGITPATVKWNVFTNQ